MRPELESPAVADVFATAETSVADALASADELVDERTGPVLDVARTDCERQVQTVHQFTATVQSVPARVSNSRFYDPSPVKGEGTSRTEAKLKAVGEAIERYCIGCYDGDSLPVARFGESDREMVRPSTLSKLSPRQRRNRGRALGDLDDARYRWTAATDVVSGREVLLPAQLVYMPFDPVSDTMIRTPVTTGAAAGTDYFGACYRGVCEVVERDHFAIGYLNELSFPRIELEAADDPTIRTLLEAFRADGREVSVYDASLDQPVSVCLAVAVDHAGPPAVTVGLGSDRTVYEAAVDALVEAFRVRPWTGDVEPIPSPDDVDTIESRRRFWAAAGSVDDLDFWLDTERTVELDTSPPDVSRESVLRDLIASFARDGRACYVCDATTARIAERGFRVVRTVVPSLHPLHFHEGRKYLGGERLYRLPVELGLRAEPRSEEELNSVPHPML